MYLIHPRKCLFNPLAKLKSSKCSFFSSTHIQGRYINLLIFFEIKSTKFVSYLQLGGGSRVISASSFWILLVKWEQTKRIWDSLQNNRGITLPSTTMQLNARLALPSVMLTWLLPLCSQRHNPNPLTETLQLFFSLATVNK